nr:MAG TPA: hypothetical protein [Caudoviricetes sp.]
MFLSLGTMMVLRHVFAGIKLWKNVVNHCC